MPSQAVPASAATARSWFAYASAVALIALFSTRGVGGVGGVYAASRSDGGARGGTGLGWGTGFMEGYSYLGMGSGRMLASARGFALVGGPVFSFFQRGEMRYRMELGL